MSQSVTNEKSCNDNEVVSEDAYPYCGWLAWDSSWRATAL